MSDARRLQTFCVISSLAAASMLIGPMPAQAEPSPIGAPAKLRLTQLGATGYPGPSVELRWEPPAAVEGAPSPIAYRVFKDDRLLATTTAASRVQRVTPLTKGVGYRFSVVAVTPNGPGAPAQVSAVAQMPPTMPLNVQAVPSNGSIAVSWDPPVDSGGTPITGYDVVSSPSIRTPCAMTGPTSCILQGLRNDQSYEVSVSARNAAYPQLAGADSDPAFATPGALPSGPMGFRALATGSTAVMIGWAAPAEQGPDQITAYQITIFEDRGPSTPRELYAITTVAPTTLTTTIEGLTPGYEYYFGVRAVTAVGMGAMTENVVVNPIGLAAAPSRVDILGVGAGAVKVGWEEPDPNGGADPSEYRITATPVNGGQKVIVVCRTAIPYEECTTDEIVTGLTDGVTYSFTVAAKNTFGYGPESTHPAIATSMGPPQSSNEIRP